MRIPVALTLLLLLAGCSVSSSSAPPTPTATSAPTSAIPTATAPAPTITPTPTIGKPYMTFLGDLCRSLATSNAGTVIRLLPYYEYNSGLRFGMLGDGQGQTADPSLMRTWLNNRRVHCAYFTPDQTGHGTLLTRGWPEAGGLGLIEADIFNGRWKINDFTFGNRGSLYFAMQTSHPILAYHG